MGAFLFKTIKKMDLYLSAQTDMLLYLNDHHIEPTRDVEAMARVLNIEFGYNQDKGEHDWHIID